MEKYNSLCKRLREDLPCQYDLEPSTVWLISRLPVLGEEALIDLIEFLEPPFSPKINRDNCPVFELQLTAFDLLTNNHGIEYQELDYSHDDAPERVIFSNAGDTYNATLMYVVEFSTNAGSSGYLDYTTLGDLVEELNQIEAEE